MISQLFNNPLVFVFYLGALLAVITIHEWAHAFAADKLGDPTARLQGRLTFNPLAHIDPIGIVLMLIFGFGWSKPVPVDTYNLRNPHRDNALIAAAGPLSNFITAILASIMLRIIMFLHLSSAIFPLIFIPLITWSLFLGFFNLIPFFPLDGFTIVGGFLSDKQYSDWQDLKRYGYILLLALIIPFGQRSMLQTFITGPVMQYILPVLIPGSS